MPRQHSIRWKQNDSETLAKAVKNYNAKIARQAKAHPETAHLLPEKMSVRELKKSILTRKELNRTIETARDFTRRGAEKIITVKGGAQMTEYQYQKAKKDLRRVNAAKRAEEKRLQTVPVIMGGQKKSVQAMSTKQKNQPTADNIDKKNQADFERFYKWLQWELSKQNNKGAHLKKALLDVWAAQLNKQDFDRLKQKLNQKDLQKLADYYAAGALALSPNYIYENSGVNYDVIVSNIESQLDLF